MQQNFNDELHTMTLSEDGSYTAYSKEYDEHYHSTRDGALHESLTKHVIPALRMKQNEDEINILDICFGLGFNTLATIYYAKKNNIKTKINIYSPELDSDLVKSLKSFIYPKEFNEFKKLILSLVENGFYDDEYLHIEIFLGDAREYILNFEDNKFEFVVSNGVIHHTSDPAKAFRELERVLKPRGTLFLGLYGKKGLLRYATELTSLLLKRVPYKIIKNILVKLKFSPLKRYYILDYIYVPIRKRFSEKEIKSLMNNFSDIELISDYPKGKINKFIYGTNYFYIIGKKHNKVYK